MNTAVAEAVAEIGATFPDSTVATVEDGGGVWVVIDPVDIGPSWTPRLTTLGFHVANTYPYADVYPHFVGADVCRADGGGHIEAVTPNGSFNGQPAVQVSRRSNRWNPANDTAALKARRVLDWLRES